ncbi:MAG TPA: nuclear transport factor 2 family protein [Woeseiaceae bacterium]|nr:nuclear transport factor 2 family protein [Woeseiaceae bacterium]
MRTTASIWIAAALLAGCAKQDCAQVADAAEEQNKKTVIAFYDAAINDKDFAAASVYLGDMYIQHNPLAADGPEGLKAFLEFAKENLGGFKIEFKRVLADGDFVIVHGHARNGPDDRGSAVMDIFRLENGKVVEHWDVMQAIPETARNDNTMF